MSTTTLSNTDSLAVWGGPYVDNPFGLLAGQNDRHNGWDTQFDAAFTLDGSAGSTDVEVQLWPNAEDNKLEVSVDGGAFSTPSITAAAAWSYYTIASGLAPGAHTITVKMIGQADWYFSRDILLRFTGAVPTPTTPTAFGTVYRVTNGGVSPHIQAGPNVYSVGLGGETELKSVALNQGSVKFRARGTTVKIWTYKEGTYYDLRIDGVDQGAVQFPSDNRFGWQTIATGLSDAYHEFVLTGTNEYFHLFEITPYGGSSPQLDLTITYDPRLFVAGYGDSISGLIFWPDFSNGYIYRITSLAGGDTLVGYSTGVNGQRMVGGGDSRTSAITGLTRKPDVTIIEYGTNDMNAAGTGVAPDSTFRDSYKTAIDDLLSGTTGDILCFGIIPRTGFTQADCDAWNGTGNGIQGAIVLCSDASRVQFFDPKSLAMAGIPYLTGGSPDFSTYFSDGVHPNEAGMQLLAEAMLPFVVPSISNTPPTTTEFDGTASGNGTVALTGTTYDGSKTTTLTSDDAADIITPSVGLPGTGSVVVTPANAATGFNYTITRATAGESTITTTNSFGATNPSPVTYEAFMGVYPAEDEVEEGVDFGPTGTEYTGTKPLAKTMISAGGILAPGDVLSTGTGSAAGGSYDAAAAQSTAAAAQLATDVAAVEAKANKILTGNTILGVPGTATGGGGPTYYQHR